MLAVVRADWRDATSWCASSPGCTGGPMASVGNTSTSTANHPHPPETFVLGGRVHQDGQFAARHSDVAARRATEASAGSHRQARLRLCNRAGQPIDNKRTSATASITCCVTWGLERQPAYQMRHTAATLWAGIGRSRLEWIARQLGHANTQMLFQVYSRYVPNLTRRDGFQPWTACWPVGSPAGTWWASASGHRSANDDAMRATAACHAAPSRLSPSAHWRQTAGLISDCHPGSAR